MTSFALPGPAARLDTVQNLVVDVDRDGRLGAAEETDQDQQGQIRARDELFDLAFVTSGPLSEGAGCAVSIPCGELLVVDLSSVTDLAHPGSPSLLARIPLNGAAFSVEVDPVQRVAYVEVRGHGLAVVDIGSLIEAIQSGTPALGLIDADGDNRDDRILRVVPKADIFLSGIKIDPTLGLAYTSGAITGVEVIQVADVSSELALDFRATASSRGDKTLLDEKRALAGIVARAVSRIRAEVPLLSDPGAFYMLEQGSGSCFWASPNDADLENNCARTGFELGRSDHDIEVFVPGVAVENVQGILTEELEELFRQEDPGVTDLNMFAMSKEAFEAAEMTIGPPVAASGSDPTGDLAMGRQHLLLLWILTGQYATLPGVLTGGPSLDGLLNQLRTTPVVPSNATGIPTLEGHERAQLERFNFYKSGALVRLKGACENGANAFGISGGAEARINAGDPDQNFNELLNLSCQDEIQAVAKAAIRSALARIVANPGANILLLSTTRGEYLGPAGCFTGVPDPSQPPTAVTPENYRPKRCGGFEEFIASTAVRSVLDGLDPPVFLAEEVPIIIRLACLKVGGDLCRNQNEEPVGDPILDTDALANQFIAEAIGFIDMAVAATTNTYTPAADTRLVGAAPGGLPFLSRVSAACQTVGFTITLDTPRGTLRECNLALVRKKIGTQQNPGVQQEAKKNLRVRALNLGSRAQEDLEVTLFEGDGVDPDTYDEQGSFVFDLEAGETRVLDVKSEPEDPGDPESPLKTKAIFPVTFDLLTLQPGVARALTFLLAPEGEGRRTVEADRLDNAAGLFYYVLDPANLTIPGTGPVPVSPDPDTSPHPLAVRRSRLELTMLIQGPGAATGGAKEATAGIYQAALLTYQVRNLGDTPLTNIEVVRGGQVVLTISQLGPNERQVQSEQFTPTQARLHNIMAVGTARDADNNMVGPAIDSVLLYVSGDSQPFDVALFDASPLSAPTHPWSRVALHFDEQGQPVPVIGTVTDGDPEGGDGRLRIRIRRLTPGMPVRIPLEDGELAGVVDGIGRLEFETGTATWINEPTVAEVIPQLDEAVIYYRPPPAFVREAHFEADAGWPASEFKKERNVRLVVTQTGIGAAQRLIKLRRPPVFLVHGLFAKRATWSDFQPLVPSTGIPATFTHVEGFDGRFDLFAVGNPGATGTFAEEAAAVRDQIGMSIRGYLRGFAIGKVDVVGHGTGGVLIRRLANTFSGNDADLSRVPFRKLVAIDAPLLGSRLASKINEINGQYLISKPQLNNPKDLLDVADILSSVTDTSEISPALKLEIKLETCAFMIQALGTTPRFFSGGAVIDLAIGSAEYPAIAGGRHPDTEPPSGRHHVRAGAWHWTRSRIALGRPWRISAISRRRRTQRRRRSSSRRASRSSRHCCRCSAKPRRQRRRPRSSPFLR